VNQTLRRVFIMLCAGAGVWILIFWLYEPSDPTVTYGGTPFHGGGSTLAQLDTVADGSGTGDPGGVVDPSLDPTLPRPEASPGQKPAPAPPSPAPSGPTPAPGNTLVTFAPRVVAPEFWEYTVQRGDNSWETIAEKTLGDRKLAPAVLRANPLVSPDKLIPGRTRLKIPRDPKNIQGKVVNEPVAPATAPAVEPSGPGAAPGPGTGSPAKPAEATVAPRTHTVAKGETLSQIAQAELGSANRWREIYEANKGVIADPDHLKLGTVLKIPGEKASP
jgi:nucleoid-associated protein YgaU